MSDDFPHPLELPAGWMPIRDAEGRVVGGLGPAVSLEEAYGPIVSHPALSGLDVELREFPPPPEPDPGAFEPPRGGVSDRTAWLLACAFPLAAVIGIVVARLTI